MNSYAGTPLNTGAQSGMKGITFFGAWSFSAPYSGTYTMRAAADDFGSCNFGGNTFSPSGFSGGGNTSSRYYAQGQTIQLQWSIGNSTTSEIFSENPCAISFTVEGPDRPPAPSVSISVSPSSIIRGNSATLSWSASGNISSVSVTDVSSPGTSGSRSVSPSDDRTYSITACGEGGCTTRSTTLVVYIPPVLTLSLNKSSIIAGQCTTLSWSTTGDANNISWTSGNITNNNLTSSSTVCPADTTTYAATVSGLGGSDSDSITLTVYQIPTLSLTVPETLDYGVNGFFDYTSQYCDISLNVKIYYRYATGSPVLKTDTNLTNASSSQLSAPDSQTKVSGTVDLNMQYDDFGPRYVDVVMTATGNGGSVSLSREIIINIDETPDNIIIPEKEDAFKSENPVFAPETEILSELLLVDDIDIPVEIKSNAPIQVDINGQQNWQNLRQI
jgi:hypothetical protein